MGFNRNKTLVCGACKYWLELASFILLREYKPTITNSVCPVTTLLAGYYFTQVRQLPQNFIS